MQKIISLFQRNYETDHLVRNEIVPGAEWVLAGGGVATRKWDGTCCMIKDQTLYKRYDAKNGKTPPLGFMPAQDPDPKTGHWPGWLACKTDQPTDRYFNEGFINLCTHHNGNPPEGTYEIVGEKINGNPERLSGHHMIKHGCEVLEQAPRAFDELKSWFADKNIEGIVWHHPDGRMVKIKKRDFGYKW